MTTMEHYKKRLIHQHEKPASLILPHPTTEEEEDSSLQSHASSCSSVPSSHNAQEKKKEDVIHLKVARKRAVCRSQFRHQNMELFKLGTSIPTSLCKTKEPYNVCTGRNLQLCCANQQNGKRYEENPTKESITESIIHSIEGSKKKDTLWRPVFLGDDINANQNKISNNINISTLPEFDKPGNGRHILPAIVPELPDRRKNKNPLELNRGECKKEVDEKESPSEETQSDITHSLGIQKSAPISINRRKPVIRRRKTVIGIENTNVCQDQEAPYNASLENTSQLAEVKRRNSTSAEINISTNAPINLSIKNNCDVPKMPQSKDPRLNLFNKNQYRKNLLPIQARKPPFILPRPQSSTSNNPTFHYQNNYQVILPKTEQQIMRMTSPLPVQKRRAAPRKLTNLQIENMKLIRGIMQLAKSSMDPNFSVEILLVLNNWYLKLKDSLLELKGQNSFKAEITKTLDEILAYIAVNLFGESCNPKLETYLQNMMQINLVPYKEHLNKILPLLCCNYNDDVWMNKFIYSISSTQTINSTQHVNNLPLNETISAHKNHHNYYNALPNHMPRNYVHSHKQIRRNVTMYPYQPTQQTNYRLNQEIHPQPMPQNRNLPFNYRTDFPPVFYNVPQVIHNVPPETYNNQRGTYNAQTKRGKDRLENTTPQAETRRLHTENGYVVPECFNMHAGKRNHHIQNTNVHSTNHIDPRNVQTIFLQPNNFFLPPGYPNSRPKDVLRQVSPVNGNIYEHRSVGRGNRTVRVEGSEKKSEQILALNSEQRREMRPEQEPGSSASEAYLDPRNEHPANNKVYLDGTNGQVRNKNYIQLENGKVHVENNTEIMEMAKVHQKPSKVQQRRHSVCLENGRVHTSNNMYREKVAALEANNLQSENCTVYPFNTSVQVESINVQPIRELDIRPRHYSIPPDLMIRPYQTCFDQSRSVPPERAPKINIMENIPLYMHDQAKLISYKTKGRDRLDIIPIPTPANDSTKSNVPNRDMPQVPLVKHSVERLLGNNTQNKDIVPLGSISIEKINKQGDSNTGDRTVTCPGTDVEDLLQTNVIFNKSCTTNVTRTSDNKISYEANVQNNTSKNARTIPGTVIVKDNSMEITRGISNQNMPCDDSGAGKNTETSAEDIVLESVASLKKVDSKDTSSPAVDDVFANVLEDLPEQIGPELDSVKMQVTPDNNATIKGILEEDPANEEKVFDLISLLSRTKTNAEKDDIMIDDDEGMLIEVLDEVGKSEQNPPKPIKFTSYKRKTDDQGHEHDEKKLKSNTDEVNPISENIEQVSDCNQNYITINNDQSLESKQKTTAEKLNTDQTVLSSTEAISETVDKSVKNKEAAVPNKPVIEDISSDEEPSAPFHLFNVYESRVNGDPLKILQTTEVSHCTLIEGNVELIEKTTKPQFSVKPLVYTRPIKPQNNSAKSKITPAGLLGDKGREPAPLATMVDFEEHPESLTCHLDMRSTSELEYGKPEMLPGKKPDVFSSDHYLEDKRHLTSPNQRFSASRSASISPLVPISPAVSVSPVIAVSPLLPNSTVNWKNWFVEEQGRGFFNLERSQSMESGSLSRRHSIETISSVGSDYCTKSSVDDNYFEIKLDSKLHRIRRGLYEKIPKGKLCYIRETNTFIRYFDDNQIKLFIRNLNISEGSSIASDLLKQIKGRVEGLSDIETSLSHYETSGKSEIITVSMEVRFSMDDFLPDPELYVEEVEKVQRYVPKDFYGFYKFVTGYQIVNNHHPISFQTFLTMHNTNGLRGLFKNYVNTLVEGRNIL